MSTTHHHRPHNSSLAPSAGLLAAALAYAERGWFVFPLRPGTKRPAVPNHPAHLCDHTDPRCALDHLGWEQRATRNPARIQRAWTHRRYGIGIACGPSRLVVIDLDVPKTPDHHNGAWYLAHLEHAHRRRLPPTFTVTTPSGGQHRYYRTPRHGPAPTNTASRLAPHIDTRAAGGYVVAPPTHTTDGRYRITDHRPPARLPTWFAELLTQPHQVLTTELHHQPAAAGTSQGRDRYVNAALTGELHRLTTAPPGTRNNTLFTVAVALGQLVGAGALDADTARQRLLDAVSGHINAGAYSHTQALQTIASGLHRGAQQPRRLPTPTTAPETRP